MVLPSQARPHPGRREPQLHGEPTRCSEPSATPQQQENPATAEEVVRASRSRAAPTSAGGGWEDEGGLTLWPGSPQEAAMGFTDRDVESLLLRLVPERLQESTARECGRQGHDAWAEHFLQRGIL